MMLNSLLSRQIQKYFGGMEHVPANMHDFLMAVTESYDHYEKDHKLLERSIELSSSEMIELNKELRDETKKLKAADHELRTLFENIEETFFSVDMKAFKLLQISHACEKTYGYTPEEFYANAQLWQDVIHPEDKSISDEQVKNLLAGNKVFSQYRIIHKDGSERWIENKVIPTLDDSGNLVRLDGITSDITERKKAEQKLIESEKKYRLVFENPFLGVALGTIEGKVMNANKAFYDLLGHTESEINNIHFSEFTHFSDVEKETLFIKQMERDEIDTYQLEKRYVTKSKNIIWVELSVSCVRTEDREIQFIVAVIQDITAKKQARESLLKSEANLRNILENTDTGYILLDKKANILSYNKIALQMTLDETNETLKIGKNYIDIMADEKRLGIKKEIDNLLINGIPSEFETVYQLPDNSLKWFQISMHPIFSEDKKVLGLSVAANNITERKNTEVRIRQSNERYELVTMATKDIIWDLDFSDNKMYRSENYKQVFGYSNFNNNIYTESWAERIHSEDRERIRESIFQKINNSDEILWEDQYRYYRANGEMAYVQDRGYIVRERGKIIRMVGAMRDITEKKMLSIERDKITSELLQRNRDLEQFAYIISHNLRAPVANIIGLVDLVQNAALNKNDSKECMDGLLLSTRKLDSVIKDLNYVLQVRREINEKKEVVLFSDLVSDIEISIQNLIKKENAVIKTNFTEINHITTLKSYLYSIFFNLISNSIKYRNGVTPVIEISSHVVNNKVTIIFKDNGLGIDLTVQENKIFGLYNKFHFHTEGKGIGLYMTKTQVEILGGKITVKSAVNQGTEFFIELQEQTAN